MWVYKFVWNTWIIYEISCYIIFHDRWGETQHDRNDSKMFRHGLQRIIDWQASYMECWNSWYNTLIWLVVSCHLKNISQIGNLPQIRVKKQNIWNHHLVMYTNIHSLIALHQGWTVLCEFPKEKINCSRKVPLKSFVSNESLLTATKNTEFRNLYTPCN